MKAGVTSGSRWLRRKCGPLLLIATGWVLTGCTSISAIHDPLYRAESHTSTITATAFTSWWGIMSISRISITVTTGEITDCTELGVPPSVIPCRRNASQIIHVCDFTGSPSTATCSYNQVLGDLPHSIVTYQAKVEGMVGNSELSEEITYAAGDFPAGSVVRPVWWHMGKDMLSKLDIGFFPNNDYNPPLSSYREFTDDLRTIVQGAFFNIGQPFASIYTVFRPMVNLWAAPFGASLGGCTPDLNPSYSFNESVAAINGVMDGRVIVHKGQYVCSNIGLGGVGTVSVDADDKDVIFVHESGHFLHGQGDEYCCRGGYRTAGNCANVFSNQSDCMAAASGHRNDPANCTEICVTTLAGDRICTGQWRNDTGKFDDIMADRVYTSNWQTDCRYCVVQRLLNCVNGACY